MQGKGRVAAPVSAVQKLLVTSKGRVDASQARAEEARGNFEPFNRQELKLFVSKNDVARPADSLRDSLQGEVTPRSFPSPGQDAKAPIGTSPSVRMPAASHGRAENSSAAFAPAPAALSEERLHIPHKKAGALKPPSSFSFG